MSAEAYRDEEMYRREEPEVINIKRNPYLVDYEQQRRLRGQRVPQRPQGAPRRVPRRTPETVQRAGETGWEQGNRRMPRQGQEVRRMPRPERNQAQKRRAVMERKRAAARRRRIVKMQRLALFMGVFCIALLCGLLFIKRMDADATGPGVGFRQEKTDGTIPAASSGLVQGLSAAEYAKHPDWEENFLTPNEYSRPGDALEKVDSIFVHYTANPNTSAAQNRSYFEQLKDTRITSASAHFIIGYNGEILQCIPLDEIAYAVQTRNFDSISIECCYKSADGSFTQETYDSLIELLAWLTDVYDLTADDILRHYDCGGKKCPIYYTEHEDAWERLKKDVTEKL